MNTSVHYESTDDDNVQSFKISQKIILDKFNENSLLIKMTFRELCVYSVPWCFNRKVDKEKVEELYNSLCEGYDIPYVLHAIYDEKHSNPISKILILDGQHRQEAIKKYIADKDISFNCDYNVYMHIQKIENAETDNTDKVIEIFKKINNHRVFNASDLPSTFIVDLVKNIASIPHFKKHKSIKSNENTRTCHQPNIHAKELNYLFNQNRAEIEGNDNTIQKLSESIQKINHIISLIPFERLYDASLMSREKEKYERALAMGFFLNLKNSRYPKEEWVKFINNPEELCVSNR